MQKLFSLIQKKAHYLALFCLTVFFIAGFASPWLVQYKEDNWQKELAEKTGTIKDGIKQKFDDVSSAVLDVKNHLLKTNPKYFSKENKTKLFDLLMEKTFGNCEIFIFDSSFNLYAWNTHSLQADTSIFSLKPYGETFLSGSDLKISLIYMDSIITDKSIFYFQIAKPVEKKYRFNNEFYQPLSITEDLSSEYNTSFRLLLGNMNKIIDGRYDSAEIRNNKNKIIGSVEFQKPLKDAAINTFLDDLQRMKYLMGILAFLFFILKVNQFKFFSGEKTAGFLLLILNLSIFRIILFVTEIPGSFLPEAFTDSSYFSSGLAYGIVSSPFEFFLTALFVLIICVSFLRNISGIKNEDLKTKNIVPKIFAVLLSAFLFLVFLRGLGAAVKSVIFDSSIFYFKFPELLPKLPIAFMHFNLLLLGICSVTVSVAFILFIIKIFGEWYNSGSRYLWGIFIIFHILGFIYDLSQKEPQGTPALRIIFISVAFVISLLIYKGKLQIFGRYLAISFFASYITVSLLIFYNSRLEVDSLRTVAFELMRPDENWFEFLLGQTADESAGFIENETIPVSQNYSSLAFICWSNSPLEKEGVNSSLKIFDEKWNLLGEFNSDYNIKQESFDEIIKNHNGQEFVSVKISGKQQVLSVKKEVRDKAGNAFYLVVSALMDNSKFLIEKSGKFYTGKSAGILSPVDIEKLKLIEIEKGRIVKINGNFTPDENLIENFRNAGFSKFNEAWFDFSYGNDDYTFFIVKTDPYKEKLLCVGQTKKDISFGLFNFFKVFIVHTVYIICAGIFLFLVLAARNFNFKVTYNLKLLSAFLLISIIPLLVMAFYFRAISEDNNRETIIYKLEKRAERLSEYLEKYYNVYPRIDLYSRAAEDMGVNYSLFENNILEYSTHRNFYNTGIIPANIHPAAYSKLFHLGFIKVLNDENLENYKYQAFYYKTEIGGEEKVIEVNTAFNSVSLPMGGSDADVFLFGTYSLAVLIIILVSTFLARQISQPIFKLTNATKAVAGGDLNFNLENKYKGEIRELIDGFNKMVKGLKKNQTELAEVERELAWKEMARQVAHEIKNPLTPMKLLMQQLVITYKDKSPKFDEIFEKVTSTTIRQIDTLKNIASEFSNFAQMPKLKLEKLDIVNSINSTVNLFADEKAKITFSTDIKTAYTESDSDQLNRTIINLIRNSIQAEATKIELKLETENDFYILRISDNGKGIDPVNAEKIFLPNFTTKTEGMGLGLSMVKRFIEMTGGKISLERSNSEGTLFLIKFVIMKDE